jgi:sodium transport system permease protein
MNLALVVARKEIRDHARDVRSLRSSALVTLMGPGVVLLVSMSDRVRGDAGGPVILGMLSVFALVVSFTGGIDIALDSTAGERERGSLLPLLLTPIRRSDAVIGKWLAVTVYALAALALNGVAVVLVLAWAAPAVLVSRAPHVGVWIALGLVPLACLGAALNLLVAARCRTTKEAHSALRSVALVPMIVGMFLVFFPEWTGHAWFVPVAGQQALLGVREQTVPLIRGAVLALVTLATVVPVLMSTIRRLDRDDVLSA